MTDIVERARQALEGVTDGEWAVEVDENGELVGHYDDSETNWDPEAWFDVDAPNGGWVAHVEDRANAEFIAAARTLMPELVDRVEFLEHEFEHERDRAGEHFDARMTAEAEVRRLRASLEATEAENERLRAQIGAQDDIAPWHYNHPRFRDTPHSLVPDGRGQGMRVCTTCGQTEPEPSQPCVAGGAR